MKKTLLLTHEYYPHHGGVANYLHGYFRFLPTVKILTDQKEVEESDTLFQTTLIGKFWRPRWHVGLRRVREFVRKHGIEIIFTPHIFPLGQIAYALKKELGLPYVISLHGLDLNLALEKNPQLTKDILSQAQHIVVNSNFVKKILDPLHLTTPITVLTPSYNRPEITATEVTRSNDPIIMLTVGRLVARKNQANVIKALAILQNPQLQYLIIGQGPEEDKLRKLAYTTLGLSEQQVKIMTNVSHADLPRYYKEASLFAMPTLNLGHDIEGYGIVYLEAAHYGLPIIASKDTAAEDFLEDGVNGLLVAGTDPEAIAAAIKKLVDDPALALQLGQAAQAKLQTLPTATSKVDMLKSILS